MTTPSGRFTFDLESNIAIAQKGADRARGQMLIEYFVEQVRTGAVPDQRLLNYLASAFWDALLKARALANASDRAVDPTEIDVRKPLGLLRSGRGQPAKDVFPDAEKETLEEFIKLMDSGTSWDKACQLAGKAVYKSKSVVERAIKTVRDEQSLDMGRNVFEAVRDELAAEAKKDATLVAQIEQRVFDSFATTTGQTPARIKKAYRAILELSNVGESR